MVRDLGSLPPQTGHASDRVGVIRRTEQSMQGLQEFFQSTVPRLQHPAVKAWAHQLCV